MRSLRSASIACVCALVALGAGCDRPPDLRGLEPGAAIALTERNGQTVQGRVASVTPDAIVVQVTPDEQITVPKAVVTAVHAVDPAVPGPAAGGAMTSAPVPPPPAFRDVVVAAGTGLSLRLATSAGSTTSLTGDPVRASVARSVVVGGLDVIPAGATVMGRVVRAVRAGHIKGRALIAIRFDRIDTAGRRYAIRTTLFEREAASHVKKDALSIGLPAAAGSIIGAIAGGGKGALIGGAVGGGAGTAYAMSTPGQQVVLPAGTVIRARLADPLTIRVPEGRRGD